MPRSSIEKIKENSPENSTMAPSVMPYVHPLDDFYAQERMPLPKITTIPGVEVPEPYKTLLVHENDMTPTLRNFHGRTIHLQVLRRQQREDYYFREVVLVLDGDEKPIEFGAIKINLGLFSGAGKRAILEERLPLGQVLQEQAIVHTSRPKAYLKIISDSFINSALKLSQSQVLYGRRNTLFDPEHRPLAEIVEILPPT